MAPDLAFIAELVEGIQLPCVRLLPICMRAELAGLQVALIAVGVSIVRHSSDVIE